MKKRRKNHKEFREESTGEAKGEVGLCNIRLKEEFQGNGREHQQEILQKVQGNKEGIKSPFDMQLGGH